MLLEVVHRHEGVDVAILERHREAIAGGKGHGYPIQGEAGYTTGIGDVARDRHGLSVHIENVHHRALAIVEERSLTHQAVGFQPKNIASGKNMIRQAGTAGDCSGFGDSEILGDIGGIQLDFQISGNTTGKTDFKTTGNVGGNIIVGGGNDAGLLTGCQPQNSDT